MNGDERISILTVFQTLKTKTTRLLEPICQAEGLTILQACVLAHLYCQDAAVGDISDLAVMDQANASSLCKKMEREGFLTRTRREPDRRVVVLSLTDKGRAAAEHIQVRLNHFLDLVNTLPEGLLRDLLRGFEASNQILDYLFEQTKGEQNPC